MSWKIKFGTWKMKKIKINKNRRKIQYKKQKNGNKIMIIL